MSKASGVGPRRMLERLFGVVAVLAGLGMAAPGGYLLMLGGSVYYLAAGLLLTVAGVELWRGRARGAWLFLLVWIGTLAWALWEAGPDGWALLPRLGLLTGMGLALALIRWRPGARAARMAATGALGLSGFPCVAGHNGQQGVPLCHDAKNLPYRMSFSISFWRAALPVPPSSRAVCSIR